MTGKRKINTGRVVSDKMDKTVVVAVERFRTHRLYKRRIKHLSKFKAHDQNNACKMGDTVRIEETRPLSKDKRWRVIEIVASVDLAEIHPKEIGQDTEKELSQ